MMEVKFQDYLHKIGVLTN